VVPRDDVDLLATQLGHDRLNARAALTHRGAHRVQPVLAAGDRHLRAATGLPRDRLDLDRAGMNLRYLELKEAAQEALVRAADVDLRPAGGPADLEHVGLDVLADAVVLGRALLRGGEDRLDVLADVEDDRPRLYPVDRARDHLPLAAGELVEDDVPLRLPQTLQHDLLRRLGVDAPERLLVQLRGLYEIAECGAALVRPGVLEADLRSRVLDHAHHASGPEDADLAAVRVDPDVDVLVAAHPPICGLDCFLDGADQLLARDLLLRV